MKRQNDDGTIWVEIENGDNERALPPDPYYILPYSRTTVFEGAEVVVTDGHSLVPGIGVFGDIVPIRLLAFRSSPHLYQSGLLLNRSAAAAAGGEDDFRWDPVAFEIIQTMILSMGFLNLQVAPHRLWKRALNEVKQRRPALLQLSQSLVLAVRRLWFWMAAVGTGTMLHRI